MIGSNLRHLRVFLAVADCGSVTQASVRCHVSQPAVTQCLAKLEQQAGQGLFQRSSGRLFVSDAGAVLRDRISPALARLDAALLDISPKLLLTATRPQIGALIAAVESQNFSLAARRLNLAQPTVHRAVTQLERDVGRPLFQRGPGGIQPTRMASTLASVARLAFAEFDQAISELADMKGQDAGRIVVGALPLARSQILPRALGQFRALRPRILVTVLDGPYDEMLAGLRHGEIDFVIGALREPLPVGDVVQERLFDDRLVVLAGGGHELLQREPLPINDLISFPWVVPRRGTPARDRFAEMFTSNGLAEPESLIETGSILLMRELLQDRRHLACISQLQARPEIERGLMQVVPAPLFDTERAIGLTYRHGWRPTPAQQQLVDQIRAVSSAEVVR